MKVFEEYVTPRIDRAEYELELICTRKIPYALARDDYQRVNRLAERAIELQDYLVILRAMEGEPDGVIVSHLACLS